MATIENLTPFQKGHKTMGGRPKGSKCITSVLRKLLDKKLPAKDPFDGMEKHLSVAQIIALKLIKSAMEGDIKAQKEILDRTEGKAVQQQILTSSSGEAIKIALSQADIAETEAKLEDEY